MYFFKLEDQSDISKVWKEKIDLFLLPIIFILHGMLKPLTAKTRLSSFNMVHSLSSKWLLLHFVKTNDTDKVIEGTYLSLLLAWKNECRKTPK